MNINELDNFNLQDAVKFHNRLNPRIWGSDENLKPEVREKLLEIAADFQEFLGVPDLDVDDITVSGSNAAFSYTPHSDIDLHLVVKMPEQNRDVYQELFNAKKYQYNDEHSIKVGGADVELYAQPDDEPAVSQGIYSVRDNKWIQVPKRRKADINDSCVKAKAEDLDARIHSAIKAGDREHMESLWTKIKTMRQTGLDKSGEFGCENLAFKILRTSGCLKDLKLAVNAAKDKELSVAEQVKKPLVYGYRTNVSEEDAGHEGSPNGLSPDTRNFLSEEPNDVENIVRQFIDHTAKYLGIEDMPEIHLHDEPEWSKDNHSFGMYVPEEHTLHVNLANRHVMDILRTTAHELAHCRQHELDPMPHNAGDTGSPWENEAHAVAGIVMRHFADSHPGLFENASGYIPKNKKEAKDPRYSMALTVDIKPGQVGKEANKLGLKTNKQGKPALLMKSANLLESEIAEEFAAFAEGVPQPGPSSGAPKQFGADAKIQTRQMTAKDIISSVPGVPYYNNVVDDYDAKDYSWGVTKKVIEYANYLKQHPETLSQLPPAIVLNGKFEDGAHRVSALWLLQQRMDPKNPLWKNAKLNVQFVQQGVTEGKSYGYNSTPLSQVPGEREDELGNQEATGPEFPPQMPAGTTKIDVSDLTDWYRLGMDISDMDDADPEDYNQGPPQTVIVFPSDEAEQGYLKQFKRLGLKTHDMDPDVAGGEDVQGKHMRDLAEAFEQLEKEFLSEVKMTSKNLAKLAKDIKGVKVGLEFEMIVPNARVEDDGDMEPDYEQDERVRDIDDAVNFFDDGDYNSRNELRRLREAMQDSYWEWKTEKIDELWHGNQGWEFFTNYLDREDPFDEEEAEEEARNELQAQYGDELDVEDFEKMLFELVDEKRNNYHQEQWDEQGSNYDNAREEFEEEQSDDLSESDWLDSQSIRYMSDVESSYGHVTWPYYTSTSDGEETDIERVALDFMNGIGADTVAYSSSYHGSYKKWTGNGWVLVGSEKPDDCFSIEPDGSLDGNSSDDVGLEFVSPPTPLEQVPDLMKRVQNWAADNGVYTGKNNKTSIHTNISVPGYDLKNLDYLKAALLLGDEYVLREFDRIGNTYAAPAIEKVKQLVQQKPEKAQELLDKMKSQLNAEASKLIHSGVTNKFTSINTKDNRVEFRSPGGDYLSIIADNPQKMIDTINRMVVTLDAAMDPNKYKQEYQKKLYKVLTGQGGGREAKSGLKQAMKASDKDLLNIFSRYAAGELPRAALKSFVRQAQLERRGKKSDADLAKHNWAIRRRDSGDIVRTFQADDYMAAHEVYKQYKQKHNITDDSLTYGPYNPAEEKPEQQSSGPTLNGRPSNPDGRYVIVPENDRNNVVYRFEAAGPDDANIVLRQWRQANPDQIWLTLRDDNRVLGQPGESQPIPGSTLDLQRQRAAAAQQQQGNWGIWMLGADRFANQPGEYPRGAEVPLYRFPSRQAAEQWIEQQRSERPRMRTDIEVREIEPREPLPDLFPELPGTPAAQQGSVVNYELYNRLTDEVIDTFPARNDNEAMTRLNDYRQFGAGQSSPDHFGVRRGPGVDNTAQTPDQAQGGSVDVAGEQPATAPRTLTTPGQQWEIYSIPNRNIIATITATNYRDAEQQMEQMMMSQGLDSDNYDVRQVATAPRTLTTPGQPQQQFTGEWKVVDPQGREIYRFGGVGNSQSDANRVAMDWLRRNPRHMQGGVEVLPVMA